MEEFMKAKLIKLSIFLMDTEKQSSIIKAHIVEIGRKG